jgi:hypothetical protein
MTADTSASTKKQRQLIAIGCGNLGIDADTRHEMLAARFGVASSTQLTRQQAAAFLDELKTRGFSIRPRVKPGRQVSRAAVGRGGGNTVAMVSRMELGKIAAVAALIRWKYENGLTLWMKKRLGIDRIRTAGDAYKVIEGLKKMFENGMKKSHGENWWTQVFDDPGIETYIREHCPADWFSMALAARVRAGKHQGWCVVVEREGAK